MGAMRNAFFERACLLGNFRIRHEVSWNLRNLHVRTLLNNELPIDEIVRRVKYVN